MPVLDAGAIFKLSDVNFDMRRDDAFHFVEADATSAELEASSPDRAAGARFEPSDPFAGEPQASFGDEVATGLPTGKREIADRGTTDDLSAERDESGFTLVELLVVI